MRLYLMQHARAEIREGEIERSLTASGLAELTAMAQVIDRLSLPEVAGIYHSGKLRARETAEFIAAHLASAAGVMAAEGLEPNADPRLWAGRLRDMYQDIMLVGHMPHLSLLTALLLNHTPPGTIIQFHNAGLICLWRDIDMLWSVDWVLIPEMAARLYPASK